MLCAEPKEHKRFRPIRPGGIGFPAGRIGDRGDREIVDVPNVYVPFPAPKKRTKEKFQPHLHVVPRAHPSVPPLSAYFDRIGLDTTGVLSAPGKWDRPRRGSSSF